MSLVEHSTTDVAAIAVSYIARSLRQTDLAAGVYFADTDAIYRNEACSVGMSLQDLSRHEAGQRRQHHVLPFSPCPKHSPQNRGRHVI